MRSTTVNTHNFSRFTTDPPTEYCFLHAITEVCANGRIQQSVMYMESIPSYGSENLGSDGKSLYNLLQNSGRWKTYTQMGRIILKRIVVKPDSQGSRCYCSVAGHWAQKGGLKFSQHRTPILQPSRLQHCAVRQLGTDMSKRHSA